MAFAKDLENFQQAQMQRGRSQAEIEPAIDLRRRGMNAPNRFVARAEARRWQDEQAGK